LKFFVGLAAVLAALGPLVWIIGALATAIGALNVALLFLAANPIVLLIAAVAALTIGLIVAYEKVDWFRLLVDTWIGQLKDGVKSLVEWFNEKFIPFFTETIPEAFSTVLDFVRNNWKTILGLITFPIGGAALIVWDHWDKIMSAFSRAAEWVKSVFLAFWNKLKSFLWNAILKAKNAIVETLGNLKSSLLDAVRWLVDKFLWFAQQIINGAAKAFGWVPKLGPKLKGAAKDFE